MNMQKIFLLFLTLFTASPIACEGLHDTILGEIRYLRENAYQLTDKAKVKTVSSYLDYIKSEKIALAQDGTINQWKARITNVYPVQLIRLLAFDLFALERSDAPNLYGLVEDLATKLAMPMPLVFLACNENLFNAFASGILQSMSIMVLGEKLLNTTSLEELEFVIAHELSHVKYYHVPQQMMANFPIVLIAQYFLGKCIRTYNVHNTTIVKLGDTQDFLLALGALAAGSFVKSLISCYHEKQADLSAASIVGKEAGISLMEKLRHVTEPDLQADYNLLWQEIENSPYKDSWNFKAQVMLSQAFDNIKQVISYPFKSHPTCDQRIDYIRDAQF